jgi:hypothetical protein
MSAVDSTVEKRAPNVRARWMVLGVWILVAVLYFNLSYDYVRVMNHDQKFAEYLQYVVQVAVNEHRPAKEVRTLLLVKAEELSLPIRGEQIIIGGSGTTLRVSVDYDVDISLPVVERGVYRKLFSHTAEYKQYAGF